MGIAKYRKGLTFVEIIVAVFIIAIITPILFNLYYIYIINQEYVVELQVIKNNGDRALSIIENIIKNDVVEIYSQDQQTKICNFTSDEEIPIGSNLTFKDKYGNFGSILIDLNRIASVSAEKVYLTSESVKIGTLNFSCIKKSEYSKPLISVSFTVNSTRPNFINNYMVWKTKVKIRPH